MSVNPQRLVVESFFGGDPCMALWAIANTYGIGLCYQGREDFAYEVNEGDGDLTDAEWDAIQGSNDWLDAIVVDSGDLLHEYRTQTLRNAGFVRDKDGFWSLPAPREELLP